VVSGSTPKFHWEFGEEIMNKINTILDFDIAGVIELSSFQCGCDAVLKEFVERRFKERKVPFLYLMVDEQTGEAGIQTRLEAFWDTLH
jgi:predicted nucleotide-binding protein (sugar kinase/HSP70/actin superfamily)